MHPKEVHLNYDNEDYFITLPAEYLSSNEDDIFNYLKSLGIKPLYEVYCDHRNRFLDVIMDADLAFLVGSNFKDVDIRQGKKSVYLLHLPSLTIISHDKEWLAIVDAAWKKVNP
jgi:hypothetical protein